MRPSVRACRKLMIKTLRRSGKEAPFIFHRLVDIWQCTNNRASYGNRLLLSKQSYPLHSHDSEEEEEEEEEGWLDWCLPAYRFTPVAFWVSRAQGEPPNELYLFFSLSLALFFLTNIDCAVLCGTWNSLRLDSTRTQHFLTSFDLSNLKVLHLCASSVERQ